MAGASRLVRTSRALQSDHIPFSDSGRLPSLKFLRSGGEPPGWRGGRKRVALSLETAVISPERKREPCFFEKGMEIMKLSSSRIAQAAGMVLGLFAPPRSEMLVEKGIIGCRSFTLIAVAGSLIGSVLCFIEGCFLVLETFIDQYFHMIFHRVDQGGIVHLLIEALDMFLVGTALLTFGMGMYVMFAGSSQMKQNRGWQIAESSFGSFNLKKLAKAMEMQSISEAKSKIGHAILLILQTGVLDKFKNVPLASALDLACFAGAVFISSACVFLLSKLTIYAPKRKQN